MPLLLNPLEHLFFITLNQAPAPLLDMYSGPASRVVLAGIRLNVFEALAERPATVVELAERLNLDSRGTGMLVGTLAGLGYLRSRGGQFGLTTMTRKWLTRGGTANFSPFLLFWGAIMETFFPKLEDSIRAGSPPLNLYEWIETQPEVSRFFQEGMLAAARIFQHGVADAIPVTSSTQRLLDVGGGHALYSIALCQKHPHLSAVVVDGAQALVMGRESIRAAGLEDRVHVQERNFVTEALDSGFDLALLFNILHGFPARQNIALLQKVRAALNPGGSVVIMDQLIGENPSPLGEALAQILGISYFHLVGGQAYTYDELRHLLTDAGFGKIRLKRSLKAGGMLLFAENPY